MEPMEWVDVVGEFVAEGMVPRRAEASVHATLDAWQAGAWMDVVNAGEAASRWVDESLSGPESPEAWADLRNALGGMVDDACEQLDAEAVALMSRDALSARLGNDGFPTRWVLTGGGSAVLRVDRDGWTASIGPFSEDGRPEDPEYVSVLGYDYVPGDDMVGSESYVYEVITEDPADVVAAVAELFGPTM